MRIDVHAHYYPPESHDLILRAARIQWSRARTVETQERSWNLFKVGKTPNVMAASCNAAAEA